LKSIILYCRSRRIYLQATISSRRISYVRKSKTIRRKAQRIYITPPKQFMQFLNDDQTMRENKYEFIRREDFVFIKNKLKQQELQLVFGYFQLCEYFEKN
jgi:hypothetical protein